MNINEMNVVITGANGALASFLLEYFSARVAFIVSGPASTGACCHFSVEPVRHGSHLETRTRHAVHHRLLHLLRLRSFFNTVGRLHRSPFAGRGLSFWRACIHRSDLRN